MYRRNMRDTSADTALQEAALADNVAQVRPEPDGDRIAFAVTRENRTDLWLAGTDGGEPRRLTGHGAVAMRYTHIDPKWFDWHPDGGKIVYTSPAGGSLSLWTVDVETGEKERLTHHDGDDSYPAFSPDGEDIAFATDHPSRGALAVTSTDGNRFELLRDDEFLYADPNWSADDCYAIRARHRDLQDRATEIVRVARDGSLDVVFSEGGINAFAPRPRPNSDADELAFVHDRTGYDAVYLLDSDGNESELLAEAGVEFGAPAWHPDGERLAVTAVSDGNTDIVTVTLDGETERLTATPGDRYFPEWHGDDVLAVVGGPTEPYHVRNCSADERVSGGRPIGFADRFVESEHIAYESSDGTEIHAMVFLPPGFDSAADDSVPCIVHPHGGPTAYDGYGFDFRAQYFAVQGYAVIEPNYRGSSGFGRAFRDENDFAWGEGDLQDVITAVDGLADAYPQVDGDRAGIFGGSGGGLMTVNALGHSDRFAAGAAFYGVYDYETFVDDTDDVGWQLMKRELGYPATDIENYREASPIRSVPDIDAPLLVLHGEEDRRVPISQSEQLVAELEKHGKTHEFQRYDGEPHGFTRQENVLDAYSRVADLFAKYLQIDPDDGTSRPHPKPH